jgi:hypothetical protein
MDLDPAESLLSTHLGDSSKLSLVPPISVRIAFEGFGIVNSVNCLFIVLQPRIQFNLGLLVLMALSV